MNPSKKPTDQQQIQDLLAQLQQKYEAMGQDMRSYLEGLLYANYLTYWDYVHLDTLLSLQTPKTDFSDEKIFIIYHQITELYFKLVLEEMGRMTALQHPNGAEMLKRLHRVNRYFEQLCHSFSVMSEGMDAEEFLRFRMALLPASGFQSVQYRMIEIGATDMRNLMAADTRGHYPHITDPARLLDHVYWKNGASELATGKKTLTLRKFEEKYGAQLESLAREKQHTNLWAIFRGYYLHSPDKDALVQQMRRFDYLANVEWPLAHLRSAVRYLQRDAKVISATGGTNWQQYLPPRLQLCIFFPDLWSDEEKAEWGRKRHIAEPSQAPEQGYSGELI